MKQFSSMEQAWVQANLMEYMQAVVAKVPKMPISTFGPFLPEAPSRVEMFDLSEEMEAPWPLTSPALLANFVIIVPQIHPEF